MKLWKLHGLFLAAFVPRRWALFVRLAAADPTHLDCVFAWLDHLNAAKAGMKTLLALAHVTPCLPVMQHEICRFFNMLKNIFCG